MNTRQSLIVLFGVWAVAQALFSTPAEAALSPTFYSHSCPNVLQIVERVVRSAIQNETRNAASLLRLHFHDCFVQGCDGSVLLDPTPTNPGEKGAIPNLNSLRAFGVVDTIKAQLESACPGVVSCADILALAALYSVVITGGPTWSVPLGRRDSLQASLALTKNLPGPTFNISSLKSSFLIQDLTTTDLVALSGAHTIGLARCVVVTPRLYVGRNVTAVPDPTLAPVFLKALEKNCPNGGDGNVTNNLDILTPKTFDNYYYKNLEREEGLLLSDQELFSSDSTTRALVETYAAEEQQFFAQFVTSIIKMGNLNVLTGNAGQIRKHCSVANSGNSVASDEPETRVEQAGEGASGILEKAIRKVVGELIGEEAERLVDILSVPRIRPSKGPVLQV